ncbi:hypothetical protein N0V93_000047 [Gnomoniopsis smithogilvyi]|uniref:Uncharacterized protein n=1 Tax=Gnomoniopsis smithogilvyi TaxID=1191159 RepID=A0A9W8Z118_9PEZI|nr:hypothetical protein N0V93_000047 [Gnomoniopsis smithogilvyi]
MANFQNFSLDLEGQEHQEGMFVSSIAMFETGSEGSGFHTKNPTLEPYQRHQVIQRQGSIDIRCSLIDVIHGVMSPDSDYWATIVVLQFRFDPQKRARRISEATIELLFDVTDPRHEIPEVEAISFDGNYSLFTSKQSESKTTGASATLGLEQLVTANGTAKWEQTVTRETSDKATVIGGTFHVNNVPPDRIAKWTLLENLTLKSGIPASLQVGVRLRRRDEAVFTLMPTLRCRADKWTRMENLFGRVPEDDPVLLKPDEKPTNRFLMYDTDNLGAIDMQSLADITSTRIVSHVEKA